MNNREKIQALSLHDVTVHYALSMSVRQENWVDVLELLVLDLAKEKADITARYLWQVHHSPSPQIIAPIAGAVGEIDARD